MTENNTTMSRFEALYRRGTELLHAGDAVQAVSILEKAHEIDPDHADAALNLSGAYVLTGRFKAAIPLLERLSQEDPENAMIWTNLGAAYLGNPILAKDEEQLKAVAAFGRALEINPIAPNIAYNLGLIYRDRRDTENAVYWFQRAIQANPNDRDAHNLLRRLTEE
jgi:tetratricopeptide (TPR) repeat protein